MVAKSTSTKEFKSQRQRALEKKLVLIEALIYNAESKDESICTTLFFKSVKDAIGD